MFVCSRAAKLLIIYCQTFATFCVTFLREVKKKKTKNEKKGINKYNKGAFADFSPRLSSPTGARGWRKSAIPRLIVRFSPRGSRSALVPVEFARSRRACASVFAPFSETLNWPRVCVSGACVFLASASPQ